MKTQMHRVIHIPCKTQIIQHKDYRGWNDDKSSVPIIQMLP